MSTDIFALFLCSSSPVRLNLRGGLILHLCSSNDAFFSHLYDLDYATPADVLLRGQSNPGRNGSFEAADFRSRQSQVGILFSEKCR